MDIEYYGLLRIAHITLVTVSLSIFTLRGLLLISDNQSYRLKVFRYLTASIDSLLLIFGISMALMLSDVIAHATWFWEKMLFLLLYIVLGTLAINRLKQRRQQLIALVLSFLCAAQMLNLALNKTPALFSVLN